MISYDSLLKVSAIQGFILVVTIKFALTYGKVRGCYRTVAKTAAEIPRQNPTNSSKRNECVS